MVSLVLFFLVLVGCQSQPTEEQLVRECQSRLGIPDVRGPFKCEMPEGQTRLNQKTPGPARYN